MIELNDSVMEAAEKLGEQTGNYGLATTLVLQRTANRADAFIAHCQAIEKELS